MYNSHCCNLESVCVPALGFGCLVFPGSIPKAEETRVSGDGYPCNAGLCRPVLDEGKSTWDIFAPCAAACYGQSFSQRDECTYGCNLLGPCTEVKCFFAPVGVGSLLVHPGRRQGIPFAFR